MSNHATIIPTLRYHDAPSAIDFLCRAFGFERHLVVEGEGNQIAHAQLTLDRSMIMIGSARDSTIKPPAALDGVNTQSPYIIVNDVDAVHARAKAAGATITQEPEDQEYGGRLFSCRDPEGHLWNFGSYDPWAPSPAP